MRVIPSNQGRKFPIELLTESELDSLLSQFTLRGPCSIRNRALVLTLARTGMRIQEALDLRPSDVNLLERTVHISTSKNNTSRTIGIDSEAVDALTRWLEVRARLGATDSDCLFCLISKNKVGRPMLQEYVRTMIKRHARRAGLSKRVHPHLFRHMFANHLMENGASALDLQIQMGHKELSSTQYYLAQYVLRNGAAPQQLSELVEEIFHPSTPVSARDAHLLEAVERLSRQLAAAGFKCP